MSEGSKVLEDQLKLMDEKYMDLRSKMEVSRDYFATQISKVKKESEELRVKYSLANKGALLDSIRIPSDYGKSSGLVPGSRGDGSSPAVHDIMFEMQRSNSFKFSKHDESPTFGDSNKTHSRGHSASLFRSSNDNDFGVGAGSQKRPVSSSGTTARRKLTPNTETELDELVTKINLKSQKKNTWSDNELRNLVK